MIRELIIRFVLYKADSIIYKGFSYKFHMLFYIIINVIYLLLNIISAIFILPEYVQPNISTLIHTVRGTLLYGKNRILDAMIGGFNRVAFARYVLVLPSISWQTRAWRVMTMNV